MDEILDIEYEVLGGALTPEQLLNLDRKLTPAEQKIVDDYQEKQANAAQAAEEKKGGPKADATVTAHGAQVVKVREVKPERRSLLDLLQQDYHGVPVWGWALLTAGVLGLGYFASRKANVAVTV